MPVSDLDRIAKISLCPKCDEESRAEARKSRDTVGGREAIRPLRHHQ
jgi:hypothetical protein